MIVGQRKAMHSAIPSRFRAILRAAAGLAIGALTWWAVLGLEFVVLRASWPAYLAAEPDKAYTLPMLLARLAIFSTTIFAASAAAALSARDVRLAWLAGAVIFLLSVPPHLYPGTVWDDYPVWYHLAYLASIFPIAVFAARVVSRSHWPAPSSVA